MASAPSMQEVCMVDTTSDWLKSIVGEEPGSMDNSNASSPTATNYLLSAASRPPLERRLRPPHDHPLKCPRCDSAHTKFCYYNNYSLSQPRYFCKTCRRYWTKGGSLRNVPVGGGCRKNKHRSSSSAVAKNPKPITAAPHQFMPTELQLSNFNYFMFDAAAATSGTSNQLFMGGFDDGLNMAGFSMDGGETMNAMVDVKPGSKMLSLEWPEQAGCAADSFRYGGGAAGLWTGMISGHGPSSAAM